MKRSLQKVWNVISTIIVAIVVILALLLVGARVVGLQVFTVLSGSMEPTYHTGSLIYVKKVDPYTIEPGQPITFMLDENAEDGSLVHYKNVIGTPVFSIPYLGYVADYIQHPPGMYIAISAGAVLLLLVFLPDIFAEEDDKEKDKTREKRAKKSAKRGKAAHDTAVKAAEPAAVEAAEPAAPEEPADAGLTDAPTEENDDLLMVDDVDAICREFEAGRFGKD